MAELIERLLADWIERDRAFVWLPDDRGALEDTRSVRRLCLERLLASSTQGGDAADLYAACIRLGGLLAERGASPTLVACALDGARAAMDSGAHSLAEATWRAARAALLEGYVRTAREQTERAAFAAWEPPKCFVMVEPGLAAVTAWHPSTDADVIGPWAGRIAGALLVRGAVHAVVAGEGSTLRIVLQALSDAGIHPRPAPADRAKPGA